MEVEKVEYESFGPYAVKDSEDKEVLKPYIEALNHAFKDEKVKNIAVLGKYGAGKSTVIDTFLYQNSNSDMGVRPLRLSLTAFTKKSSEDKEEWLNIEQNLIQQMLYGPSNSELPDSKYQKIEARSCGSKVLFLSIYFAIVVFLCFIAMLSNKFQISIQLIPNLRYFVVYPVGILSALYLLWLFLSYIRKTVSSAKLGWGKSELVLTTKETKSAFNTYLDEILYFFTQKKYNLVILEDIDRFDNIDTFNHLRALNNILNSNTALRKAYKMNNDSDAVIKFLYAVKEDLFDNATLLDSNAPITPSDKSNGTQKSPVSEESIAEATTKFFDFTISVLPYVSFNNSADYLIKRFNNPEESFKDYLHEVSIYFGDIRVLASTINDFKLYSKIHCNDNLNPKNLFAVLLFKNGFPRQFKLLEKQEGPLHDLLRTRKFQNDNIERLRNRKKELEDEKEGLIEKSNREVLLMYKGWLVEKGIPLNDFLKASDDDRRDIDIVENMTFQQLRDLYIYCLEHHIDMLFSYNQYGRSNSISFDDFENAIEGFDATNYFKNALDGKIAFNIQKVIENVDDSINEMVRGSIYQFAKKEPSVIKDQLKNTGEAQDYLSFAIINGYLDESVDDYLSSFSGYRISQNDIQLVRRLRSGGKLEFEETIENIPAMLRECLPSDFEKPSFVLADLIIYAVERKEVRPKNKQLSTAYQAAVKNLSLQETRDFSKNYDTLLIKIPDQYLEVFTEDMSVTLNNDWSKYQGNKIKKFVEAILEFVPKEALSTCIDSSPLIVKYINSNQWLLSMKWISQNATRADIILHNSKIQLDNLDVDQQCDKQLIMRLIKAEAVACVPNTIPTIFKAFAGENCKISYASVGKINNSTLTDFIEKNFMKFINIELTNQCFIHETAESITKIIVKNSLEVDMINDILQQYKFSDLVFADFLQYKDDRKSFDVVQCILNTLRFHNSWQNLQTLMEWEQTSKVTGLVELFLKQTHCLTRIWRKGIDSKLLIELVNTYRIEITPDNATVFSEVGKHKYHGINQSNQTIHWMIQKDLVKLSMDLIDKVEDQKDLVTLAKHCITSPELTPDEERLANKLDLEKLYGIVLEDNQSFSRLQSWCLKKITNNYLKDENLGDEKKSKLIRALLLNLTSENNKEIFETILRIYNSYDEIQNQMNELRDLCANSASHMTDKNLLDLTAETKNAAINAAFTNRDGKTKHILFEKNIMNLLQLYKKKGLVTYLRKIDGGKKISFKLVSRS